MGHCYGNAGDHWGSVCTGGRGAFSIDGDPLAPALARDGIDRARPPGPTAWLEAGCA